MALRDCVGKECVGKVLEASIENYPETAQTTTQKIPELDAVVELVSDTHGLTIKSKGMVYELIRNPY